MSGPAPHGADSAGTPVVALDGFGAEQGFRRLAEGARAAAADGIRLRVFGPPTQLRFEDAEGIEVIPSDDCIANEDDAVPAVRSRPEASVVRAAADVVGGRRRRPRQPRLDRGDDGRRHLRPAPPQGSAAAGARGPPADPRQARPLPRRRRQRRGPRPAPRPVRLPRRRLQRGRARGRAAAGRLALGRRGVGQGHARGRRGARAPRRRRRHRVRRQRRGRRPRGRRGRRRRHRRLHRQRRAEADGGHRAGRSPGRSATPPARTRSPGRAAC